MASSRTWLGFASAKPNSPVNPPGPSRAAGSGVVAKYSCISRSLPLRDGEQQRVEQFGKASHAAGLRRSGMEQSTGLADPVIVATRISRRSTLLSGSGMATEAEAQHQVSGSFRRMLRLLYHGHSPARRASRPPSSPSTSRLSRLDRLPGSSTISPSFLG